MLFKKTSLLFVAMVMVVVGVAPAFAETPSEYYARRASSNNGWTPEQEKCYQANDQLYNSVRNLDNKVREVEADVIRREAEVEAKEAALQQQQQASVPPAGEFVAPQQLIYRNFYYPYNGGCVLVSGWYPWDYVWPGWWYCGFPPYGYPIYGWCHSHWNGRTQTVVVNNITVNKNVTNHEAFRRDVRSAFSATHAAPKQPQQQKLMLPQTHPQNRTLQSENQAAATRALAAMQRVRESQAAPQPQSRTTPAPSVVRQPQQRVAPQVRPQTQARPMPPSPPRMQPQMARPVPAQQPRVVVPQNRQVPSQQYGRR